MIIQIDLFQRFFLKTPRLHSRSESLINQLLVTFSLFQPADSGIYTSSYGNLCPGGKFSANIFLAQLDLIVLFLDPQPLKSSYMINFNQEPVWDIYIILDLDWMESLIFILV